MAIGPLLAQLRNVRHVGPLKWQASCPAHEDRAPSLALREMADGRVLLHCFGGCSPDGVVGAVGMTLADLMPDRIDHYPQRVPRPFSGDDALRCLVAETTVIALVLSDLMEGREQSDADLERLCQAASKLAQATEYVHGLG